MMLREGFVRTCPRCNGTGKETILVGILNVVEREIDCIACKGKKQVFTITKCPLLSGGQLNMGGGNTNVSWTMVSVPCLNEECVLWDREHDGGCLFRKALELQSRIR
jgi:hypothetical protein